MNPCQSQTCTGCGADKPLTEFFRDASRKIGVTQRCKTCTKARNKAWRVGNPDKWRGCKASWEAANAEKAKEMHRRHSKQSAIRCGVVLPPHCVIGWCFDCGLLLRGHKNKNKKLCSACREARDRQCRRRYDIEAYIPRSSMTPAEIEAARVEENRVRKMQIDGLSDGYVRRLLAKSIKVPHRAVPDALVEVKRAHLRLVREIKLRSE